MFQGVAWVGFTSGTSIDGLADIDIVTFKLDVVPPSAERPYTHTLIHSYTHTLIHSYTHILIYSYTHTLIHSYIHALHILIHSYTHTLIHSYTHRLLNSLTYSHTLSIHLLIQYNSTSTETTAVTQPPRTSAGVPSTFDIQSRDACSNAITLV